MAIMDPPGYWPDWMACATDSWNSDNEVEITISPGATLALPIGRFLVMPPVYGSGLAGVRTYLAFELISGEVEYTIGVANPSGPINPMHPFVGENYPLRPRASVKGLYHAWRFDEIEPRGPHAPVELRSWTMTRGQTTAVGNRQDWPSLSPSVTNTSASEIAVIKNLQVKSDLVRR
jgi:hypothetical protein